MRAASGWVGRARSLSLFYKVLIANAAIVVAGAIGGTWITVGLSGGQQRGELVMLLAAVGLMLSVALNYLVLRAAFQPVEALRRAADEVRSGDLQVRARPVLFPDPALDRLRETFNGMLDDLEGQRDQLRALSSQALTAQEQERKRIARDLHDGVAQQLSALLLGIGALRGNDHADFGALRQQVAATLEEVRRLARELRPSVLDDLGLPAALGSHIDDLRAATEMKVGFVSDCKRARLPADTEVALYRIAQEAITNAIKHASATRVDVELVCSSSEAKLRVSDDGVGFDVAAARSSRRPGLGLFGMEERAALVRGHLTIDSAPGRGATIIATAPLG